MSKIICDVCGTSYPETVNQCPICGCVRSVDVRAVAVAEEEEIQSAAAGSYNFVKGGRFSKSNVKKRQSARTAEPAEEIEEEEQENEAATKKTDRGLLVAFIVLLLSVAAVVCYILVRFLSPGLLDPNSGKKPVTGDPGNDDPVVTTEQNVQSTACEDISINQQTITIAEKDGTFQLEVTLTPEDTEDELTFQTSDAAVATVTEDGLVTAVASGEAIITVTCGEITKTCTVTCSFNTTEPTLPNVPEVDLPVVAAGFELNRSDFSMFKKGETWTLYSGSIPASEITWTSSNPKVATVSKGKVTAVSSGKAVITAEYQDSKLTCTVYCKNSVGAYVESEDSDTDTQAEYKLNKKDVTIDVGESFTLKLTDANGQPVDATFTTADADICSVSGGTVTGVSAGKVNITASYDGQSFVCIVRVK